MRTEVSNPKFNAGDPGRHARVGGRNLGKDQRKIQVQSTQYKKLTTYKRKVSTRQQRTRM